MASHPLPQHNPGSLPARELTQDEWWDLFKSLQEATTKQLEEVGGADAWFRYLRHDEELPAPK